MGSAGEKEKGRVKEKITPRGQKGCWVIKEIKMSEKGGGLSLCISPRTWAGIKALVTGSPHFNTDVPQEGEPNLCNDNPSPEMP